LSGCSLKSPSRAGVVCADLPGQHGRAMALFVAGLLCIKLVLLLLDPIPKFFFGDSGWYIGTAIADLIPPDRSFTYGYLIRFITFGSKSFFPLVASQVLASTASTALLVYALRKYFSIKPTVAFVLGVLCAVEPIQLLYERHVMTEAFSLFCFALYLVSCFEYLSRRRIGTLCLIQVLGTALITLRISFLPLVLINTVFLPLLASCGYFREENEEARFENSGTSCGWKMFRIPALHLVIAVCLAGILHGGYKQAFSKVSGYPPAYNAAGGFFLVSIWAPAVEPEDFPYPELRSAVFDDMLYDLKDRFKRNEQLFAHGGLVENIRWAIPGTDSNDAAMKTAINALKRNPAAIVMLSFRTLGDFFNLQILREKIANDLSIDDEEIQLYRDCQDICGQQVEFPTPIGVPQPMTFTKSYYEGAFPWYWFLIFAPVLCIPALLRTEGRLARLMMIEAGLAICASAAIACFMTPFPVVRYLHPVSWLIFFPLAILVNGVAHRKKPDLSGGDPN
jgi:hypothetical protein